MIRASFVRAFGEECAAAIECAAEMHRAHLLEGDKRGSDPFRDCIVICIGYECMTRPEFRDEHGILPDPEALKSWVRANADLEHHDGPIDYIALVTGAYEEWIEHKALGSGEP